MFLGFIKIGLLFVLYASQWFGTQLAYILIEPWYDGAALAYFQLYPVATCVTVKNPSAAQKSYSSQTIIKLTPQKTIDRTPQDLNKVSYELLS